MAVGALELDGHAVDREHRALDFDLAEAGAGGEDFVGRPLAAAEGQDGGIEVGRLGGPLGRVRDRNG